ncbi:hypothetical protein FIV42_16520 [Persicimonas caeni]|uniref:VWA domain-containing protein n=1 Tax=Persicimonas caeni TaxID=2292766 RepID=A0A4Y6PV98_PERCE|nr:hypothetical protein [Persicimonas caeni]QDG52284.1 hypothetical protein FIV42_16520 [Persicimonas caeni]QED33506.1 hypothetical protein FRD00_16515 [Persicimonas caeni]
MNQLSTAWHNAQRRWSQFLVMSDPLADDTLEHPAQIDMGTRQVSVNLALLEEKGVSDCLEALLAHELGHHVRWPASMAVEARLRILQRQLVPIENYSLTNLFEDLLINEHLADDYRDEFIRLYRAVVDPKHWQNDPAFFFYMAVYEELWRLEPDTLMGGCADDYEDEYPNYRAEAQLLAQNLYRLGPNIYTQFTYFLSVFVRYIKPPEEKQKTILIFRPLEDLVGEPSAEDWADALIPTAKELEAIQRAIDEGWLSIGDSEHLERAKELERRIGGLPGVGGANAEKVPEIMAAFYRRKAEEFLLRPPTQPSLGEAVVPTTMREWEPGRPVGSIDWMQTFLTQGEELGRALPLERERIAEIEGYEVPMWQPRMEIYLDVSGSMPDPRFSLNAMTLAAQILCVGTIRAGGFVRALMYSHHYVDYWEWCRSEVEMSRFLMHYVGGGTEFPFERLRESVTECGGRQPIRVIITDHDFDRNYEDGDNTASIFGEACTRSAQVVILKHTAPYGLPDDFPNHDKAYRRHGATVIGVTALDDFPRVAADLAFAFFEADNNHLTPQH